MQWGSRNTCRENVFNILEKISNNCARTARPMDIRALPTRLLLSVNTSKTLERNATFYAI